MGGPGVVLGVADGGALKAAGHRSFHARVGVLHHQADRGGQAQHLRRLQEHLGVGLRMGDAVAVRHGVKVAAQAQALQDEGGVLAGGTDGQLAALGAELIQGCLLYTSSMLISTPRLHTRKRGSPPSMASISPKVM